ncbi:hypothetical protein ABPG72_022752 [Tetrahymena utriculariae]
MDQFKLKFHKWQSEQNSNANLIQKQKQVYQTFKEYDRIEQFNTKVNIGNNDKFSRLLDDLHQVNVQKMKQIQKLRGKSQLSNQDVSLYSTNFSSFQKTNDDTIISTKHRDSFQFHRTLGRFQSTLNSTFLTMQQSQRPDFLKQTIDLTIQDEQTVLESICLNEEIQETLEQKIEQLKYTAGKIKREMKDFEKEDQLLNTKLKQLSDQELIAFKKKNIVKCSVKNFKQELELDRQRATQCIQDIKKQRDDIFSQIKKEQQIYSLVLVKIDECNQIIEQQKQEIKQLDMRNEEICQKLLESQNTVSYLDTLNELERMFIKGEIDKSNSIASQDITNSVLSEKNINTHSSQQIKQKMYSNEIVFDKDKSTLSACSTPRKPYNQKKKIIVQQHSKEYLSQDSDRQNLISKLDFYYNEHGKGPNEIAGYLIKQYREFSLSSQSLFTKFEELTQMKKLKALEYDKLENQISQIQQIMESSLVLEEIDHDQVSFQAYDTDQKYQKLLNQGDYGELSLNYIKEVVENTNLETFKLVEYKNQKDKLSFGFFHNMVEILYRYTCLLKLSILSHKNSDKELKDFYQDFSRFICSFRLGFNPKRNIKIDATKYVDEIFENLNLNQNNKVNTPSSASSCSNQIYTPKVKFSISQQFSDVIKEMKMDSLKQNKEEEAYKREVEKFNEKLNFIPFNKAELDQILKNIFPIASQTTLEKWYKQIKESITYYYATEQDLQEFLDQVRNEYSNLSEECQLNKVFENFYRLSQKAYELHHQNIIKILEFFQKFQQILHKKKNDILQISDEAVKNNFNLPVMQQQHKSQSTMGYVSFITDKQINYLNYQGEVQDPITTSKIREEKEEKQKNIEVSQNDDSKKLIFKLTKNDKKIKLDSLNASIQLQNLKPNLPRQESMTKSKLPSFLAIEEDDYLDSKLYNQKQSLMNEFDYLELERKREKYSIQVKFKNYIQQNLKTELEQQKKLKQSQILLTEINFKRSRYNKPQSRSNLIFKDIIQHNKVLQKLNYLSIKKDSFTNQSIFTKIKDYCPKSFDQNSQFYIRKRPLHQSFMNA